MKKIGKVKMTMSKELELLVISLSPLDKWRDILPIHFPIF
jgi:hypothetical protein